MARGLDTEMYDMPLAECLLLNICFMYSMILPHKDGKGVL